jgi:hypothetical protein
MNYWLLFWTILLLISGAAFASITLAVSIYGCRDLRDMLRGLTQQKH